MTHSEQRVWMIQRLLEENPRYAGHPIPASADAQKDMLRALMNVREPMPISSEFLGIQDEYLSRENALSGITDVDDLEPSALDDRICLWQGDITTLKAGAIVNAANSQLCGCFRSLHNCIDNIIHSRSGIQLRLTCHDIMQRQGYEEPTGQAKLTPAYNLPCDYVLHTVGPIVEGRLTKEHEEQLASCYRSCLGLAAANGIKSVAFCCISTGVFMFPNDRAAHIAVDTVRQCLDSGSCAGVERVVFNVFKDVDRRIYEGLLM